MITIDPQRTTGPVKALHGVNLGPLETFWTRDYSEHFRAAGIPSVRTHDASLFLADVVDLHTIFPVSTADPDDPDNYRFELTDAYVRSILDTGADVYFRLGESVEHWPHKLYVRPDLWTPERMARVCANIVRHYNHGWADGHEWGIEYWEFWNEPELAWRAELEQRRMWVGTPEQFLDFYRAVAPAVKAADPTVKVGLAGFASPTFLYSKGHERFVPGWSEIVEWCASAALPIDFVSWHRYGRSWTELAELTTSVRTYLDGLGLTAAESHLTEWHYLPQLEDENGTYTFMNARMSGDYDRIEKGFESVNDVATAAFTFGALARFQHLPLDLAHHYTGISGNWGLFTASGRPNVVYEAFVAFHEFTRDDAARLLAVETSADVDPKRVAAVATVTDSELKVGIAHLAGAPPHVPVRVGGNDAYTLTSLRTFDDAGWHATDLRPNGAETWTVPTATPGITLATFSRT